MSQDTPSFLLGREPINSGWSTDVCFGAHSELQSDIAPCPTSAHFRTHALRQKHATQSPRRHAREILCIGIARACTAPKVQEGSAAVAGLRRRATFRDLNSVCRAPGNWNSHIAAWNSRIAAEHPTVLPIRILQLRPAVHSHLSPHHAGRRKSRLAVTSVWSSIIASICK
jgi:hypothetical protein